MPRPSLPPIHPGEILKEEFMLPLGLSINRVARELHVPPNRICLLVNKHRAITADTAIRLGVFFQTTPQFWMNLQSLHDLEVATSSTATRIKKEVRRFTPTPASPAQRTRKEA